MDNSQILARWKLIAGDTSEMPWTEESLRGFFHFFRPHGNGLAEANTVKVGLWSDISIANCCAGRVGPAKRTS